ncbi:hypothetical protein GCM10025882_21380 [Acinetobacter gyllenbergii]|uniref:Uncharacterized protein n=1 Tax=Acinetobacter gyllenbergii CIP 110306 = MTCC 11365 TaxID=1217657 RepID=A0A829HIJ9_9GAMM|nr:hypothetical protein [Acinetobacter gyllenbergii]EPF87766.1 hypothetical protein F957_01636 [Acinetobacter gyllenbergii CIP 110306 = MTCC 11365]EPH34476.1 hypothetical protein L293_3404 [Acinetobacter gyllenbergii CIP 110306 = MTCC 11365]OBY75786.1 signal peptide protein [Acinetobacter gyllenbergii]GMA11713.1 hypothetical protein GCM10025882_21380 [Acinetobacter gyllenbergii]
MNSKLLFSSLICSLCFSVAAHADTKASQDQQAKKYQQVCKGKKQGDPVSFAFKGVVFNGSCEPNEAGKLAFQPPTPASNATVETQSRLSETQSAPRPVSSAPVDNSTAPMEAPPMAPTPPVAPDVEQTAP